MMSFHIRQAFVSAHALRSEVGCWKGIDTGIHAVRAKHQYLNRRFAEQL